MTITWGRVVPNPDASGGKIMQAIVDGKSIGVDVSVEVLDDFGIHAAQVKAEEKIEAGDPARPILIRTSDFR